MDASSFLLLLVLFVAVAIGWLMGRSAGREQREGDSQLSESYFKGLNYLINEQSDEAVDLLIDALAGNDDGIEMHFVLGQLLRKQGQPDRAIRVHQSLLSRAGLDGEYRSQARYELALDFINAGLFDRARRLLEELIAKDNSFRLQGLKVYLKLCESEGDWDKALSLVAKLSKNRLGLPVGSDRYRSVQTAYLCELSERALSNNDLAAALLYCQKAQKLHTDGWSLSIEIKIAIAKGRTRSVEVLLRRLLMMKDGHLRYYLSLSRGFFKGRGDYRGYVAFLQSIVADGFDELILVELLLIGREVGDFTLGGLDDVLRQRIKSSPSLLLLGEFAQRESHLNTSDDWQLIADGLDVCLAQRNSHKCSECGFDSKQFYWRCPSCKRWRSLIDV